MRNSLINILYYAVLGFKYIYLAVLIPARFLYFRIHNIFTFAYNQLSKYCGWKKRFYYAHEKLPDDALLNKIQRYLRIKGGQNE